MAHSEFSVQECLLIDISTPESQHFFIDVFESLYQYSLSSNEIEAKGILMNTFRLALCGGHETIKANFFEGKDLDY